MDLREDITKPEPDGEPAFCLHKISRSTYLLSVVVLLFYFIFMQERQYKFSYVKLFG